MGERGISVDHATVSRWVIHYLSLILEIVALNALTNFVNQVAQPVADLSVVQPCKAA